MLFVNRITNSFFASNTYIITAYNSKDCFIIDIGDTDKVLDFLSEGYQVKAVFLTHSHCDHIYGINKLCEKFPLCVVYTSEYGEIALRDYKKNLSLFNEQPMTYMGANVSILKDGDKIELFDNTFLNVIATPGHCESCLTYIIDNYIFTGDAYIPGIKVVTNLPKGNKNKATESLYKIMRLVPGRVVCPGHGNTI